MLVRKMLRSQSIGRLKKSSFFEDSYCVVLSVVMTSSSPKSLKVAIFGNTSNF